MGRRSSVLIGAVAWQILNNVSARPPPVHKRTDSVKCRIDTRARTNRHRRARIDTGAHELTHGGDEPAVDRGSGQGPGVNRPPPTCLRTTPHPFVPAPLRTSSRAPTSALLPTPVQHVCRPPSTPMLNRFYLFYISLFSSPLFYLYLGYPSRHPHQPDRSEPPIRDFRPPISRLQCWAAPWSPRWLIARRRPPKPSPAKHFSEPGPPPVCQQSWRSGADSGAGAGGELSSVSCGHRKTTGRAPCDAQPGCECECESLRVSGRFQPTTLKQRQRSQHEG